jgi:hypothetical protein
VRGQKEEDDMEEVGKRWRGGDGPHREEEQKKKQERRFDEETVCPSAGEAAGVQEPQLWLEVTLSSPVIDCSLASRSDRTREIVNVF